MQLTGERWAELVSENTYMGYSKASYGAATEFRGPRALLRSDRRRGQGQRGGTRDSITIRRVSRWASFALLLISLLTATAIPSVCSAFPNAKAAALASQIVKQCQLDRDRISRVCGGAQKMGRCRRICRRRPASTARKHGGLHGVFLGRESLKPSQKIRCKSARPTSAAESSRPVRSLARRD
jgi:hypothetical protein